MECKRRYYDTSDSVRICKRKVKGGEAGAEAILPLRTFWNNLSQYIAESNKGGNTITNEIKIVINADNKTADEIADDVINVIVPKIQKCMANM